MGSVLGTHEEWRWSMWVENKGGAEVMGGRQILLGLMDCYIDMALLRVRWEATWVQDGGVSGLLNWHEHCLWARNSGTGQKGTGF